MGLEANTLEHLAETGVRVGGDQSVSLYVGV